MVQRNIISEADPIVNTNLKVLRVKVAGEATMKII